ncbi:alpha-L-rhamnosidase-related protein [Faecalibacillus intestinalis]|uniref:alpha-L-rhamnosidase-related protein n=1 Tax=Faecalibacillus intestinalis TaxID=1982626 RepID=UPI002FD8A517
MYHLSINYKNMKAWVDHIIELDNKNGLHHLLDFGFHFADWLSLDNPNGGPFGKTDMYYVSSVYYYYYYYSVLLVSKAAKLLKKDEYIYYYRKAEQIRTAIRQKYIKNGHVNITTQTALVLAIYFKILNEMKLKKILIFLKK